MIGLEVRNIQKTFGKFTALDKVCLTIPQGKFVCFLGPSGCGKTTLLRIIAGLEQASDGSIHFNGKDISNVAAHQRGFAMVFQSLALFPHLNVADNIAYSMKVRGQDHRQRSEKVSELLDLIQLPDVADRKIQQLSGGQRQRVAIARALAQEPKLFLLDEPMSALDAKLREEMQLELRQLQRKLKITSILVTHDQKEAMTMADIVVVMRDGRIEQVGAPLDIYNEPASLFVADFIGQSNKLPCYITDGHPALKDAVLSKAPKSDSLSTDKATIVVRPENLRLSQETRPDDIELPSRVRFIRDIGSSVEVYLNYGDNELVSVMSPRDYTGLEEGESVIARFDQKECRVFAGHG